MSILRQIQQTVNELLGTEVPTDQVCQSTLRNLPNTLASQTACSRDVTPDEL